MRTVLILYAYLVFFKHAICGSKYMEKSKYMYIDYPIHRIDNFKSECSVNSTGEQAYLSLR